MDATAQAVSVNDIKAKENIINKRGEEWIQGICVLCNYVYILEMKMHNYMHIHFI